ncbi:MAG: hypothetical protein MI808_02725 [Pseudomonadales bacterium]|nr:hypothetical protein [Pseudomonadales bacterium]
MKSKKLSSVRFGVFAGLLAVSVSACSQEKPTTPKKGDDLLPFNVSFDRNGAPVLVDENGEKIKPVEVEFPIKATAVERIDTVTIVQIRGSHFKMVKIGSTYYKLVMPHR